jgi:hypothetical protein
MRTKAGHATLLALLLLVAVGVGAVSASLASARTSTAVGPDDGDAHLGSTSAGTSTGTASGISAAASGPEPSLASEGASHSRHLRLTARVGKEAQIDVGAKGESVGDYFTFTDRLYDAAQSVGTDAGVCTLADLSPRGASVHCVATLSLRDGQLTAQGLTAFGADDPENKPFTVAVTGGTGRYRNAHGEMTITPVNEDVDRYDLQLRY